ncbi:MAG: class I SAM-dependent methyltransferase [Anaerolineae bacterium]|nr:class I SAM-dependent methyltransferase [Anaerolineae bacterium]
MYSLVEYGNMIADKVRSDAYARALKSVVKPDSIVLDIGAGTGIHTLLACKFGAARVYAVESNPAIHLAQEVALANGYAGRTIFIQDLSTNITLPERVNIVVSDLRGILPFFTNHIASLVDARRRHLVPGGQMIPHRDTLYIALIEAPKLYQNIVAPWNEPYGLNMAAARTVALNRWSDAGTESLQGHNLLTEPYQWAVLDYATIADSGMRMAEYEQPVLRDGTAHGLLVWFDSELVAGIGYSNSPDSKNTTEVYGRAFFPILEPIPVVAGDRFAFSLQAEFSNGDYVWHWHTRIVAQSDSTTVKADFVQSTAFTGAVDDERNAALMADYRPKLSLEGQVDRFILGLMTGAHTLTTIANQTYTQFPSRFTDEDAALSYVYELAQHYNQ